MNARIRGRVMNMLRLLNRIPDYDPQPEELAAVASVIAAAAAEYQSLGWSQDPRVHADLARAVIAWAVREWPRGCDPISFDHLAASVRNACRAAAEASPL